ncbi:hypothetical protein AVEN_63641-1 [Araneus ventricosus]|uniref:Uncharacterized protein n=1 Tax=Araneus ventricosus TaxID=182803 RepID=A0A4Y2UQR3_ARAVE|nr:hypothetical protein AVEN_63641-1 [Araneus ventricosus]
MGVSDSDTAVPDKPFEAETFRHNACILPEFVISRWSIAKVQTNSSGVCIWRRQSKQTKNNELDTVQTNKFEFDSGPNKILKVRFRPLLRLPRGRSGKPGVGSGTPSYAPDFLTVSSQSPSEST